MKTLEDLMQREKYRMDLCNKLRAHHSDQNKEIEKVKIKNSN